MGTQLNVVYDYSYALLPNIPKLTRYQIKQIARERGSGTCYTPQQCSILQTHRVCKNKDDLCRRIYYSLKYYD